MLDKYGTGQDPYCYASSSVLINNFDIRDGDILQTAESEISLEAARGIPFKPHPYDFDYLKSIHHQLFSRIRLVPDET